VKESKEKIVYLCFWISLMSGDSTGGGRKPSLYVKSALGYRGVTILAGVFDARSTPKVHV
jgi:hypothetical protein